MKLIDISQALKDPYSSIEQLENFILAANKANNVTDGTQVYPDELYDQAFDVLKKVKPNSKVLMDLWDSTTEVLGARYTELLERNPMKSITTIKDVKSASFKAYMKNILVAGNDSVDFIANVKLNGHGIRLVYEYGKFVSATSRARRGAGNDLTKQMKVVLRDRGLLEIPLTQARVEIRGEVLLPLYNLGKARAINPSIVSAFTGVSSLLKASGKESDWELLDFVAYRIFTSDNITFDSRSNSFKHLENLGFIVPAYWVLKGVSVRALESVATRALEDITTTLEETDYPYYLDGVVLEVNNTEIFTRLGGNIKYDNGNVALKVGNWAQLGYHGFIQYVEYKSGSIKMSPVAIVASKPCIAEFQYISEELLAMRKKDRGENPEPIMTDYNLFVKTYGEKVIANMDRYILNYDELGVLTASGNMVRAVPLYEVSNIVKYGLHVGSPVTFNYGGEAGVTTVFNDQEVYLDIK